MDENILDKTMATDSSGLTRPRDIPSTLGQAAGLLALGFVGNALYIPIVLLPTLILLILSDATNPTVFLTPMFGVYIAVMMGSITSNLEQMYERESKPEPEPDTEQEPSEDEEEPIFLGFQTEEEIRNFVRRGAIVSLLMITYMNALYLAATVFAQTFPAHALYLAVFVPIADRVFYSAVGTSPGILIIEGLARLVVLFGIVDEIDLTIVRQANLLSLA